MPFQTGVHGSSGRLAEKEVSCCEVEMMRPYSECKFPRGAQNKPDRITMQEVPRWYFGFALIFFPREPVRHSPLGSAFWDTFFPALVTKVHL